MLSVHSERIGEIAVIECEGRIVRSEAAFKLSNCKEQCTRKGMSGSLCSTSRKSLPSKAVV